MKQLVIIISFFTFLPLSYANQTSEYEQANVFSIEEDDGPQNFIDVSEEGFPLSHYVQLLKLMNSFKFTPIPKERMNGLFEQLKKNPRARSKFAGGGCSIRRAYIQNYLKKMNIISGKIFVHCPGNIGRMRLKDRATGHVYTFSNFHDANIVARHSSSGPDFYVMDLQFQDNPVSLHDYLTEIEASQRIRPARRGTGSSGHCYWTVSTPYLSY